jgi:hypothetical protein
MSHITKITEDTKSAKLREVTKTFLTGKVSCTLIISKDIAKKYGIDEPSHVVVEERPEGILIRKLAL